MLSSKETKMKNILKKLKIGELMSKILLITMLVAFVLSMGLSGNKKAIAQGELPYTFDGADTYTFTRDTFIQTDTYFDNNNLTIENGATVTLDGEHTFK